jgi:hypothetical protein
MAWVLRFESDLLIIAVFASLFLVIVLFMNYFRSVGWQLEFSSPGKIKTFLGFFSSASKGTLRVDLDKIIGFSISAYFVLLVSNGIRVSLDVSILSIILAVIFLFIKYIGYFNDIKELAFRGLLYVTVLMAVSLDRAGVFSHDVKFAFEFFIFGIVSFCLFMRLFVLNGEENKISTMDVLVLIAALIIPNLPGSVLSGYTAGLMVIKSLLLLYAIENIKVEFILKNNVTSFVLMLFYIYVSVINI